MLKFESHMKKALILWIVSSFFFAFTFIFNRSMNLGGGHWIWSASLRYFWTFPILALIVFRQHGFKRIHAEINKNRATWLLWSTVGFGLFYAPLSFAGDYGESWLMAASWQLTLIAGVLLAPVFGKKIPVKNLGTGFIILAGVGLLQARNIKELRILQTVLTIVPMFVAAVSFPLGNRKMLIVCSDRISTIERAYGMTLCSIPFWIVLASFGLVSAGSPSGVQLFKSFSVALFSGVIATLLFLKQQSWQKKISVIWR